MSNPGQSPQREKAWLEIEVVASSPPGRSRRLGLGRWQAMVAMSALTLLGLYLLAGLILVVPAVGALFVGAIDPTSRRRRAEPPAAPDSIYAGLVNRGRLEAESMAESLQGLGSLVEQIESHEEAHPERQRATPSISPLGRATFVMTSPFGSRRNPFTHQIDLHAGLDLAVTNGTPILAPADGVVTFAGRYQLRVGVAWWRFGNLVALRHGEEFVTVFGHCDEVRVRRGERVRRGDLIATVGNSGWSTNPHLHYEVRRLDATGSYQPIDPRVFILDQSWRDEEQILIGATRAIDRREFESLPRSLRR